MTLDKTMPEKYYPSMYLDGFMPEQILMTAHRQFIRETERGQEEESFENVHITSEVKIKK